MSTQASRSSQRIRSLLDLALITTAAWLLHPFLLPTCADLVLKARANQAAVTTVGSTLNGGSTAAAVERTLTAALSQLPGPTVLAAAGAFLGAYAAVRLFQAARR